MSAKDGDVVKVTCRDETIEGVLLPSKDDFLTVKLASGYNLGIDRSRVVKIELVSARTPTSVDRGGVEVNPKLPIVSILHTGGTIASKVDYETGGVAPFFTPEDLLGMFPELGGIANIRSRLVRNMWSQDMRFSHYNLLAKEVKNEVEAGASGVIITQGTDTLHYSAAALSFIFESLPIPVILVGAQRSSDRGSSDAALNVINAVYFITKADFAEVAVCMHKNLNDESCWILPGTKCRKMHTSRRDAFRPISSDVWAVVDYSKGRFDLVKRGCRKRQKNSPVLKLFNEKIRVGLLKQHINMFEEEFSFFSDYDGLVIESTGLGCLPISDNNIDTKESGRILTAIKTLIKKGIVVTEAPQTIYGRINMKVYEDQRIARSIGVLGHLCDMTPETAFIKLAWLLSNFDKNKVKELYEQSLRWEISDRSNELFLV